MTTKKEPPKESVPVITGSGLEHAKVTKKNRKLYFVAALVVIVALLGLYFAILNPNKDSNKSSDKKAPPTVHTLDGDTVPSDAQMAQTIAINGDYAGAISILQAQLAVAKTPTDKAGVLDQMALAAINSDKPSDALTYATQANELKESARSWGLIGLAQEAQSNWKAAAEAYGKAASLSPKSAADVRSDRNEYLQKQKAAESNI